MRFAAASLGLAHLILVTACGYTFRPDGGEGDAGFGDGGALAAPLSGCEAVVCPAASHCDEGVCVDDRKDDSGHPFEAGGEADADADADPPAGDSAASPDPEPPAGDSAASPDPDPEPEPPAGDSAASPDPDPGPEASGETCGDALDFRFRVQVEGDTRGMSNDIEDDCAISWGPDIVYSFVAETTGVVSLQVEAVPDGDGARWDTTLYLRRDCGDGDVACNDDIDVDDDGWPDIGWSALSACVEQGRTYHVVVDGYWADSEGPFVLVGELRACDECDAGFCP